MHWSYAFFALTHRIIRSRAENLLGDGCFGRVYRARYKGQTVAVKVYMQIGDISPHKLLRQEVRVGCRLVLYNHMGFTSMG